jgi:[ribosomal protein S5]-alanine N-acetyltransferase
MLELQFLPFKTLHTKRLVLREITMEDTDSVFSIRSNKNAMKYIGKPIAKSIDEAKELIQKFVDAIKNNEGITWGICLSDTNNVIGTIGFWRISKEHYRAEIGYMLHPDYWNKGIVTEAAEAVLEFGFKQLKFHSVEAFLTPENLGSVRLLEKSGFKKEGHFKENYFFEGVFSDTAVYSILNPHFKT